MQSKKKTRSQLKKEFKQAQRSTRNSRNAGKGKAKTEKRGESCASSPQKSRNASAHCIKSTSTRAGKLRRKRPVCAARV